MMNDDERAAEMKCVLRAHPGYTLWQLEDGPDDDEDLVIILIGRIIAWALGTGASPPIPITDEEGLRDPDREAAVGCPDGTFFIADDSSFTDRTALETYIRKRRKAEQAKKK